MIEFIKIYPAVAWWFIGALLSLIGTLIAFILALLKLSVDRLNKTICNVVTRQSTLESAQTDFEIRLVEQVTRCNVCQDNCDMHVFKPRGDERRQKEERRSAAMVIG